MFISCHAFPAFSLNFSHCFLFFFVLGSPKLDLFHLLNCYLCWLDILLRNWTISATGLSSFLLFFQACVSFGCSWLLVSYWLLCCVHSIFSFWIWNISTGFLYQWQSWFLCFPFSGSMQLCGHILAEYWWVAAGIFLCWLFDLCFETEFNWGDGWKSKDHKLGLIFWIFVLCSYGYLISLKTSNCGCNAYPL